MRVSVMRLVDRLAGVPVCLALTAHRRIMDLFRRLTGPKPKEVRRILVVKLAEQGATVLAYPALKKACELVGRENVYFLVFEENRFILDLMEVIPKENVVAIPTRSLVGTFTGALRALWRIRRLYIDAAVDFEFFSRSSAALAYLSGAGIRAGYHSFGAEASYRGDLMTHRLSYNPYIHVSIAYRIMMESIGLDADKLPALDMVAEESANEYPAFVPGEEEVARVRKMVSEMAGDKGTSRLVLLNANCSDLLPVRRWPGDRYVDLARRLLDGNGDVTIAFTGAPDEEPAARELVESINSPRCFSLAGRTTLRELLVLYTFADVLVTNDSGPAQFAALTPVEVVTLFGPETPVLFGSPSPRNHVVRAKTPCSPCVSAYNNRVSPCRNNVCMQRITVDEVLELVRRLLAGRVR